MNAVTLPSTPVSSIDPKPSQLGAELSAQELAIETGRRTLHGNASDRVLRMFDAIRAYGSPRVTVDRAVYFTESFKTTEGQPMVLRWAKALKHITENIPVTIFDDELLVGRPNTWLGRYGLVYGELDGSLLKAAVEVCARQKGQKGAVVVTDEDQRAIEDVLHPYWNGKDFGTSFVRALPEETRFFFFGPDRNNVANATGVGICSAVWRHSQNWAHDFAKILNKGCAGIRAEAEARLAAIDDPHDVVEKKPFLEAIVITCDAMTTWARRYSGSPPRWLRGRRTRSAGASSRRSPRPARTCRSTRRAASARRCRRSGSRRCSRASSRTSAAR